MGKLSVLAIQRRRAENAALEAAEQQRRADALQAEIAYARLAIAAGAAQCEKPQCWRVAEASGICRMHRIGAML